MKKEAATNPRKPKKIKSMKSASSKSDTGKKHDRNLRAGRIGLISRPESRWRSEGAGGGKPEEKARQEIDKLLE